MTAPRTFRALALLLACACAAALAGCAPKPRGDKKGDGDKSAEVPVPPAVGPGDQKGDGPAPVPKSTLGEAEKGATDAATAFTRDIGIGAAKAEALSAPFLKAVGKPLELPSDKEKGFSADNAGTWLKRAGDALTFGLPIKQNQVGETVFIRGTVSGPRFDAGKTGSYCLRLVKDGGAWKVDLLTVSSADNGTVNAPETPEGVAQAFALAAFVELTADGSGLARDERGLALGALLTPELRAKLAGPFDSDKAAGLDFNRGALVTAALKVGGGTAAFTATRAADGPTFAVELTKPAGKVRYTVKLAKGPGANEWLVSEVTEAAKG